jgi:hypothetical protein
MLPKHSGRGGLETLLWKSVQGTTGYARARQATDDACTSAGVHKWEQSKHDKARIRILIALLHRKNPALALARAWDEAALLVPVESRTFDDLAQAITKMP